MNPQSSPKCFLKGVPAVSLLLLSAVGTGVASPTGKATNEGEREFCNLASRSCVFSNIGEWRQERERFLLRVSGLGFEDRMGFEVRRLQQGVHIYLVLPAARRTAPKLEERWRFGAGDILGTVAWSNAQPRSRDP